MKALVQRVSSATVYINEKKHSHITAGLCLFLGIKKTDTKLNVIKLVEKVINLRVFSDKHQKMNKSIQQINGDILVVSQFTLYADCKKGNRPSFHNSANKLIASPLYQLFINLLKEKNINVKSGDFGSNMNIGIVNNGCIKE